MSKPGRAALVRRAERIPLLPAVLSALGVGLATAVFAYGFLRWITPTSEAKAAPIDVTKVALTVVAGVGGVVALVIAYRRQRDLEQSRFVERFGAAAAQLGANDVAVRIAGVYAMAGVADEADGLRRQQCIDVLCGYLRLPYSPELGGNHQTKHVQKRAGAGDAEDENHFEYRQNDRVVRATIVRVIADHLRSEDELSWSASDFDFRTAHLEDADFSNATFSGPARFEDATFSGLAEFGDATFSGPAWFQGAMFAGNAQFEDATFCSNARFRDTTFSSNAAFERTTFSSGSWFERATFSGDAWFYGATFSDDAEFGDATFSGHAEFHGAPFSGNAGFSAAKFSGDAEFHGATFSGGAWFSDATFSGAAGFHGATFSHDAGFSNATFSADAGFSDATFSGAAEFHGATFSGATWFQRTKFSRAVRFQSTTFSGATTFEETDFGAETISFADPKQWGPPAPLFDWAEDVARKPANVEPQDWPPLVAMPPAPAE